MLSSERSRKRLHPDSDYPVSPIKRTITDRRIVSLSSEDQVFISKAASIVQVPNQDVPITISQSSPLAQLRDTRHLSPQEPEQISQAPPIDFWNSYTEQYPQLSAVSAEELSAQAPTPLNAMYGAASSCLPDKVFGFTRSPRQWADCFAGLVPFRQAFPNQYGLTNEYHDHPEKVENGLSASEMPRPPSSSTNSYISQPYYDEPPKQMLKPMAESHGNQLFACDDNSSLALWQSRYLALAPVPVETRQPLIKSQNMAYRLDAPYQAETQLSHNTHANFHGYRRHHATQAYDSEIFDSGLKDDFSEALEGVEHAANRRENGPSRRRPFQKLEDRVQTAQTRKDKACLRCRMQKVRCIPDPSNPQGVCLTCQKVTSMKVSSLPCVRYKITEIRLFKPGQVPGLDWTQRWLDKKLTNISEWKSPMTRRILTTEGFSSVPLELEVREFVPQEGDVLERHWCIPGGIIKSVKVPCFAIADVNVAQKAYVDYINQDDAEFFKGWLRGKDDLLRKTYSAAIATANDMETHQEEAELLKKVLRLWVAIRITTRSIRIRGEDTLGMPHDILDETSPLHGEIPIPPVMGAQIELILIQEIQIPLRKMVLDKLQNLIQANKPSTWFTRYLCLFILLHNCAMITKYDAGYAKKYIPERTYARPNMVGECHTGANVLLAYWHYCNKGSKPFAPGSSDADFHAMSKLNPYQTSFVRETSTYVQANVKSWKRLYQERAYGHDYYFVSQLYEPDWKPRFSLII